MRTTNEIWSVDLFRSNSTFVLSIVDQASRRVILCEPVDIANVSRSLKLLNEAFRSFGAPAGIITDHGTFFGKTEFSDLLSSCEVFLTVTVGPTLAERRARTDRRRSRRGLADR